MVNIIIMGHILRFALCRFSRHLGEVKGRDFREGRADLETDGDKNREAMTL
jgi:hypothetical protein